MSRENDNFHKMLAGDTNFGPDASVAWDRDVAPFYQPAESDIMLHFSVHGTSMMCGFRAWLPDGSFQYVGFIYRDGIWKRMWV